MGKSKDLATGAAYQDQTESDTRYVNTAGDTMTGNLGIGASPSIPLQVEKAGGGNFVASFQNTTSGTPYGVHVKDAASGANGYPLFQVTNSAGSTAHLKVMSGTGHVLMASQPSFYAYPSASFNTPVSSWTTVTFNTTAWDVGSNYNTSNYRFTAPVAGKYLITWMLQLENTNEPTWIYAYPVVNGSTNANRSKGISFSDFKVTPNYHTENGAWIMNLSANDYITFNIYTSGASKHFKAESHWAGHLLG